MCLRGLFRNICMFRNGFYSMVSMDLCLWTERLLRMNSIGLDAHADVLVLENIIGLFLEFSSRTLGEQCVTSLGIICSNARRETPFTEVGRIDAELEVTASPGLLKSGLPSKAKNRQREVVTVPEGGLANMIVIARMHPGSNYSLLTGNRWGLDKPDTHGKAAFMAFVQAASSRMVRGRRSSTHYLMAGWIEPIRLCLASPLFKGKYRTLKAGNAGSFALDHRDPMQLGGMTIELGADAVTVTAVNEVGAGSNAVLDEKHRAALIRYAGPPLQQAIGKEESDLLVELDKRMQEGYLQFNRLLSGF